MYDVKKSWSNKEKAGRNGLSNELKMANGIVTAQQIRVGETKNLPAGPQTTEVLRRNEPSIAIGKIIEYKFWMIKQGYAKSTKRIPEKQTSYSATTT